MSAVASACCRSLGPACAAESAVRALDSTKAALPQCRQLNDAKSASLTNTHRMEGARYFKTYSAGFAFGGKGGGDGLRFGRAFATSFAGACGVGAISSATGGAGGEAGEDLGSGVSVAA